ncbi:hypothetical protein bcgnr5406_59780 [Bacillus cereus]
MLGGESIKEREKKEKVMYTLKIDNTINKDTDCKVYSLTMMAEENRMRSTIIKTSMEVHDVLFNLLRDHNDHTVVCTVKST